MAGVAYKKVGGAPLVPKPSKACVRCGLCAKQCPLEAIDPRSMAANPKRCIGCMRCLRRCSYGARRINEAAAFVAALAIRCTCSERKECELFL